MKLRAVLVACALLLSARSASAALTVSEKAQVKDFVGRGQLENVARVRSLVARTDLTQEESTAALVDAFSAFPFTDPRALFAKELVFGGASAASRPGLAYGVVKALLARADAVYQKYVGGLDHEPRAVAEIVAIYGFLDEKIANAGHPTATSHDATAGIPSATYDDCSKAIRDHVDQNSRWLKGDGSIGEGAGRVRAQAQVLLVDMLPDGTTRRVDAADRLALKGARRAMLTDWGILLVDAGKLDDAAAERVRQILAKLPAARTDLEVLYAGEDKGPLRARGIVAQASTGVPGADAYPFSDEVAQGSFDAPTSVIAYDLAVLAARRALEKNADLRGQAEKDALAGKNDPAKVLGKPRAPSTDHAVGAAIHLLVLDAPRAIDLAAVRMLNGKPESAALLSDAIGALVATAPTPQTPIELGKGGGTSTVKDAKLAANGVAIAFSQDGRSWTIDRNAPAFLVSAMKRDGATPTASQLSAAKAPLRDFGPWTESGWTFTRMNGQPRASVSAPSEKGGGPTVKLLGSGKGFDAIATTAPGADFVYEGELTVTGGAGGLSFRAVSGASAVRGAMLIVTPQGRTTLVTSDDAGAESQLADPLDPSPATPIHVKITVAGAKVEAVVGSRTMTGTLPATLAKGDVGLVARSGASVQMTNLALRKK
jgi:hypothetical protein